MSTYYVHAKNENVHFRYILSHASVKYFKFVFLWKLNLHNCTHMLLVFRTFLCLFPVCSHRVVYLHIYISTYLLINIYTLSWPRTGRTCTILAREPRQHAEDRDTTTLTLPPPTAELRTWLLVANWEPSHCICIYSLAATSVPAHPSLPWPRCYLLVSLEASCPVWRRLWWCDGCNCLHGQDNKVTGIIMHTFVFTTRDVAIK